jgi:nitrite reductase/ring-hydroxylating ferredoxin subunit
MKKLFLLAVLFPIFFSCSNNGPVNNNPYIPNYTFTVDINMNLPLYSNLQYPSNAVYYAGKGVKGLLVFNTGSGYNAFDAACPNQSLSACSTMTINGIEAVCPCDSKTYSLFSGQGSLQYPMKQYRVEVNGNVLRIYN